MKFIVQNFIAPKIIGNDKYLICIFSNGKGGFHLQWVNTKNIKGELPE